MYVTRLVRIAVLDAYCACTGIQGGSEKRQRLEDFPHMFATVKVLGTSDDCLRCHQDETLLWVQLFCVGRRPRSVVSTPRELLL